MVLDVLAVACATQASCTLPEPMAYDDISYVRVFRYSFVPAVPPTFQYTGVRYPRRIEGRLLAEKGIGMTGTFEAVDPQRTFGDVVNVLRLDRFYERHFAATTERYLDGPEDEIVVGRCGAETRLGWTSDAGPVDRSGPQAEAFRRLEADLQAAIVAARWHRVSADVDRGDFGR